MEWRAVPQRAVSRQNRIALPPNPSSPFCGPLPWGSNGLVKRFAQSRFRCCVPS